MCCARLAHKRPKRSFPLLARAQAYLADKATLVKEGEVAIVQSYDGRTRALGRGLYLSATVGTSVRKFALSENVIRHANIVSGRARLHACAVKALSCAARCADVQC
jgi:hypothetical protein